MANNDAPSLFCGVHAPAHDRSARIAVSSGRADRNVKYKWGTFTTDLSIDTIKAVIGRAMRTWERAGAGITFTEATGTTAADFVIEWVNFDTDKCLIGAKNDEGAVAHVYPWGSGEATQMHFRIGVQWGDRMHSLITKDVETVAVHELGHILGLGHSDDSVAVMAPEMWVSQARRDLVTDDRNGIFALYPSWRPLAGQFRGTPAVVSSEPNRADVFVRGSDDRVYYKWRVGMEWFPGEDSYDDLGGTITTNVTAVSWGPKRIDLFHNGTDKAVWHKYRDGGDWSGWTSLGGKIEGDISAVSWAPNRLDLFVKSPNSYMYHKTWDGKSWSGWIRIGGQPIGWGSPKAVCWGSNRIDIFIRGALSMGSNGISHSDVYQKTWDGVSWQPTDDKWTRHGGSPTGEVAVVSKAPNRLDLFIKGPDDNLLTKSWNGSKWDEWQNPNQGGTIKSAPSAIAWPGANMITLAAVLPTGEVGLNDYNGNATNPWTGWITVGPALYPNKKANLKLVDNPVIVATGTSRGSNDYAIATLKEDTGLYVYH